MEKSLTQLQKQAWAKDLYGGGTTPTEICKKVGCDSRTLNTWIKDYKWDALRAMQSVSKRAMRQKLLALIDAQMDLAIQNNEFAAFNKESMGMAKLLEQLDSEPVAQMAVTVFPLFYAFLQEQQENDPAIDQAFLDKMDSLQDLFVRNHL
jgi:transposase-like protein